MANISRKDMPQVDTKNLSKALKMASKEAKVTGGKIKASKLKGSQKELHKDKVIGISKKFNNPTDLKPLIISSDNYIVDGHHRWGAAIYKWGEDVKIPIVKIHLRKIKAINLYNDIAKRLGQPKKESIQTNGVTLQNEDVYKIDNKMKEHDKLLVGSIIEFVNKKYGINPNILVKKTANKAMLGYINLNDNAVKNNKFTIYFNNDQSISQIIKSVLHELIHVKQVAKGELKPSTDYKSIMWKHKPVITVTEYKKLQKKSFSEYKKLPWEDEAYSAQESLYSQFLKSSEFKSNLGKDSSFDYMYNSLNEVIEVPIEIGDTVLGGKFKNKKIVVKSIGKNEKGDITINGKSIMRVRTIDDIKELNEAQNKLKLNIPSNVLAIHKAFKKEGKKLYIVGGAVRDAILGQTPHDFDLATDAKPNEVLDIAKKNGFKTAEVGKAFGVVIIDGEEIATFRKDIGKGRRPDSVDYTDIEGDVKRRDLTINALFYDIDRKEIVDLVGGIADLKSKSIRTVGKAGDRFDEDPLRKLRALRFAAKLGGKIEKDTFKALKDDPNISGVSAERIRDEFVKSLTTAKSQKWYLKMVDELKMLQQILPNIKYSKDFIDNSNYKIQIAYILRNNQPDSVFSTLKKLKYTDKESTTIKFLVSLYKLKDSDVYELKKAQKNVDITSNEIIEWGKLVGTDLKRFANFELSVGGSEVKKLGFKGRDIGTQIEKMEMDKYLNESVKGIDIKNFKDLFLKMPTDLQKRVYNLKNSSQSPKHHPEGNVLKHTILVVNRSLKDDDIDIALAAMFHDIGKDETASSNLKTRRTAHLGHEKVSADLVKKYKRFIESVDGNVANVFYIVKNHMRVKNLPVMRKKKQDKLKSFRAFDKLDKFTKHDKGGYGESVDEMAKSDIKKIDTYADSQLKPIDIDLTGKHFFDRLNDTRNRKEITSAELIGFFKRLGRQKHKFVDFLNKYKEIVATDNRTNINIPFMRRSNKAIAKTVMRKVDFKSDDEKVNI